MTLLPACAQAPGTHLFLERGHPVPVCQRGLDSLAACETGLEVPMPQGVGTETLPPALGRHCRQSGWETAGVAPLAGPGAAWGGASHSPAGQPGGQWVAGWPAPTPWRGWGGSRGGGRGLSACLGTVHLEGLRPRSCGAPWLAVFTPAWALPARARLAAGPEERHASEGGNAVTKRVSPRVCRGPGGPASSSRLASGCLRTRLPQSGAGGLTDTRLQAPRGAGGG